MLEAIEGAALPAAAEAGQRPAAAGLVPLPQLLNIASYLPDSLIHTYVPRAQLQASGQPTFPALEDWIEIFRHSIDSFSKTAAADESLPEEQRRAGAAAFSAHFRRAVDGIEERALEAAKAGPIEPPCGCLELCRLREQALLDVGFVDIYRAIKTKENSEALQLLREVCAEIDGLAEAARRWETVIRGVFAGNIFDLGTASTTAMYHENGGVSFHDTRDKLLPRPWAVDCLDQLVQRLATGKPYRKALVFVDNSGADVILGVLPLARELVRQGTQVVLAANERPSINDITFAELDALLPSVGAADDRLCKAISSGRLRVMCSGSALPVVDLARISAELAAAAGDADLVILEGMGRSIETNLNASLSCDRVNLGMIKHPEVAAALGGRMFDVVCKYVPADSSS